MHQGSVQQFAQAEIDGFSRPIRYFHPIGPGDDHIPRLFLTVSTNPTL
jgi:hypothetical protein